MIADQLVLEEKGEEDEGSKITQFHQTENDERQSCEEGDFF